MKLIIKTYNSLLIWNTPMFIWFLWIEIIIIQNFDQSFGFVEFFFRILTKDRIGRVDSRTQKIIRQKTSIINYPSVRNHFRQTFYLLPFSLIFWGAKYFILIVFFDIYSFNIFFDGLREIDVRLFSN